jgi:hypothetical protein
MKSLHRPDLYCWSVFDTQRNVDFNSIAWIRPEGNILIDPLQLSAHDWQHLASLGSVAWVIVTNSDHIRGAQAIAHLTGAKLAGPAAEKDTFPVQCQHWLAEGDDLIPGLTIFELNGSKTAGELSLLLEDTTLVTGDLIRAHQAGSLMLLPTDKLQNHAAAISSVKRLAALPQIEAVLVGDGWSIFRDGHQVLVDLTTTF